MTDKLPEWQPSELPDLPDDSPAKQTSAPGAPVATTAQPTAAQTQPAPVSTPAQPEPSAPYIPQFPQKPGASAGTITMRVFGFACLGIVLFVLISACSALNSINNALHNLDSGGGVSQPDPRVAKLQPMVDAYKAEFDKNLDLIPNFAGEISVAFNRGPLPCPDAGTSPDTCFALDTSGLSTRADKKICDQVLTLAKKLGATEDSVPNSSAMKPLDSNSISRCVSTMNSYPRSVGWGWFSPSYFLQGQDKNKTPFIIQLSLEQDSIVNAATNTDSANTDSTKLEPELWKYSITTSTSFDTSNPIDTIPNYSDSRIQAAAMLDTVAYYRRSNNKIDPFDGTFAKTMLNEYKQRFRFTGTAKAHADSDGTVHWVQFGAKDFTACISVGQLADLKAENDNAMADMLTSGLPGGTMELSGLGQEVASMTAKSKFGDYVLGTCH